jgi:hypothetical protein
MTEKPKTLRDTLKAGSSSQSIKTPQFIVKSFTKELQKTLTPDNYSKFVNAMNNLRLNPNMDLRVFIRGLVQIFKHEYQMAAFKEFLPCGRHAEYDRILEEIKTEAQKKQKLNESLKGKAEVYFYEKSIVSQVLSRDTQGRNFIRFS